MSIFIRGMDMPTSCNNCWALDDYGDYPRCRITEEQRGYNFPIREKRMDKCPLVPVPPHGRLIDADALDDAFTNLRWTTGDYKTGELAHWGDRKDWCLKGQEVDTLIKSAPTIIQVEEGE